MRLDGFGLFVDDMPTMVRFYRDVLGFEITEGENAINVYLIKDGTLFMLYERKNVSAKYNDVVTPYPSSLIMIIGNASILLYSVLIG